MLALRSLSGVGALAAQLCVVVAPTEVESEGLKAMAWAALLSYADIVKVASLGAGCPAAASGILIVSVGQDVEPALRCCGSMDQVSSAPPIITVLISTEERDEGLEKSAAEARTAFLEAGADDVISLCYAEVLTAHRVQEAIQRTEVMAQKAAAMIKQEVEAVKKKTKRTLQLAWKRFMWELPGNVLDKVPYMDESLKEHTDEQLGVSDYVYTAQLGSGTFGSIFKADHPKLGTVAMKVIARSSVKTVNQLFAIDSELCIMMHLPRHPSVVKAHTALHTASNIILVMDYAGDLNLHTFIARSCKGSAKAVLPPELAYSFCQQEAAAVAHLHEYMVCHRDLKPSNFVMANDGLTLRLTDFGLAALLCGLDQKLTHCCGSLPFAAPEVLRLQQDRKVRTDGYSGFCADVWSLAANFVELLCGLYSMEHLLGWVPAHPADLDQRIQDLERFEQVWASRPEMNLPSLHGLIANMFALRPEQRFTIGQVMGRQGLDLEDRSAREPGQPLRGVERREHFASDGFKVRPVGTVPSPSEQEPLPRLQASQFGSEGSASSERRGSTARSYMANREPQPRLNASQFGSEGNTPSERRSATARSYMANKELTAMLGLAVSSPLAPRAAHADGVITPPGHRPPSGSRARYGGRRPSQAQEAGAPAGPEASSSND